MNRYLNLKSFLRLLSIQLFIFVLYGAKVRLISEGEVSRFALSDSRDSFAVRYPVSSNPLAISIEHPDSIVSLSVYLQAADSEKDKFDSETPIFIKDDIKDSYFVMNKTEEIESTLLNLESGFFVLRITLKEDSGRRRKREGSILVREIRPFPLDTQIVENITSRSELRFYSFKLNNEDVKQVFLTTNVTECLKFYVSYGSDSLPTPFESRWYKDLETKYLQFTVDQLESVTLDTNFIISVRACEDDQAFNLQLNQFKKGFNNISLNNITYYTDKDANPDTSTIHFILPPEAIKPSLVFNVLAGSISPSVHVVPQQEALANIQAGLPLAGNVSYKKTLQKFDVVAFNSEVPFDSLAILQISGIAKDSEFALLFKEEKDSHRNEPLIELIDGRTFMDGLVSSKRNRYNFSLVTHLDVSITINVYSGSPKFYVFLGEAETSNRDLDDESILTLERTDDTIGEQQVTWEREISYSKLIKNSPCLNKPCPPSVTTLYIVAESPRTDAIYDIELSREYSEGYLEDGIVEYNSIEFNSSQVMTYDYRLQSEVPRILRGRIEILTTGYEASDFEFQTIIIPTVQGVVRPIKWAKEPQKVGNAITFEIEGEDGVYSFNLTHPGVKKDAVIFTTLISSSAEREIRLDEVMTESLGTEEVDLYKFNGEEQKDYYARIYQCLGNVEVRHSQQQSEIHEEEGDFKKVSALQTRLTLPFEHESTKTSYISLKGTSKDTQTPGNLYQISIIRKENRDKWLESVSTSKLLFDYSLVNGNELLYSFNPIYPPESLGNSQFYAVNYSLIVAEDVRSLNLYAYCPEKAEAFEKSPVKTLVEKIDSDDFEDREGRFSQKIIVPPRFNLTGKVYIMLTAEIKALKLNISEIVTSPVMEITNSQQESKTKGEIKTNTKPEYYSQQILFLSAIVLVLLVCLTFCSLRWFMNRSSEKNQTLLGAEALNQEQNFLRGSRSFETRSILEALNENKDTVVEMEKGSEKRKETPTKP